MNPWLFALIISFILFLLLVDWSRLAVNIYGGFLSFIFKLIEGNVAYHTGLWKHNYADSLINSISFLKFVNIFSAGIAFTMGIIYFQLIPKKMGLQFIHAFIWATFFAMFNFIAKQNNMLIYIHFRFFMVIHLLVFFLCLAWFKTSWLGGNNSSVPGRCRHD